MKKYNLSKIMKRAWELVKTAGMNISAGLKKAWREAKEMKEKKVFKGKAKVAQITNGETNPYIDTEHDCESNYYTFNLWEKYGKKRIYVNEYGGRAVAYIDLNNNNKVETEYSYGTVIETVQYFLENYIF